MDAKNTLRQIIREELRAVLKEQARNWWLNPSDISKPHENPHNVHEQGNSEEKPRVRKGQRVKKRKGATYVSAGTIPKEYDPPRELDKTKIYNRKAIGDKMLNAHARKSPSAAMFRQKIKNSLERKGKPTDLKHQYSQIWAWASGMAANGGTAADWSVDSGSKSAKAKKAKAEKKKQQIKKIRNRNKSTE